MLLLIYLLFSFCRVLLELICIDEHHKGVPILAIKKQLKTASLFLFQYFRTEISEIGRETGMS